MYDIDITDNIDELPTLPEIIEKLRAMHNSPDSSSAEIAKVIMFDPALSVTVLKIVNSAYFGCPRLISSISKAIVLIGFERVVNIALSSSVLDMKPGKNRIGGFDLSRFWQHSATTAIAAEVISQEIDAEIDEEVFIGGLLHDIGKIALAQYNVSRMSSIIALTQEKNLLFYEAENELQFINHAVIGSQLADKWDFPESLKSMILYHHKPFTNPRHQKHILIVHLADILARSLLLGNGGDYSVPRLTSGVLIELDIQMSAIETIMDKILKNTERIDSIHKLISSK